MTTTQKITTLTIFYLGMANKRVIMSNFVRHEQCPACAKLGKDNHHDNLGIFADGSVYCWSCGYSRSAKGTEKLKEALQRTDTTIAKTVSLPRDICFELPVIARDYLRKYSLTQEDINVNRIMWSEEWQRIVFPYFDGERLLGWQGRYLGNQSNKGKWYSQGDLKDIMHICGTRGTPTNERTLVLVEDVVSAIRVGHTVACAPLFGSHLSVKNALRYNILYPELVLWLDKDKEKYSMSCAHQLQMLGLHCISITTDKDPKEYSDKEIREILDMND